ncbi:MAG: TGS domain-containing protein [Thermoprotei archaeon]
MKVQVVELPSVIPGQKGKPQPVTPDLVIVFLTREYSDADSLVRSYGAHMLSVPQITVSRDGVGGALPLEVDLNQLEKLVIQVTGIKRIYLKSPQEKQPDSKPMIFRSDVTVGEVAEALHRSLAENFKYARVWGSVAYQGQKVGKSYKLSDGDVVEIHS